MGLNSFFTPFTTKWAKYLLLSVKRLATYLGDMFICLHKININISKQFFELSIGFLGLSLAKSKLSLSFYMKKYK